MNSSLDTAYETLELLLTEDLKTLNALVVAERQWSATLREETELLDKLIAEAREMNRVLREDLAARHAVAPRRSARLAAKAAPVRRSARLAARR